MAITAALIGGAAILGGAGISAFSASKQNKEAASSVQAQHAFQEGAYRHRYQWTMEDMRIAGLNPILAYKQGVGGGLSGSTYSPVNVGAPIGQGVANAASTAIQIKRSHAEIEKMKADAQLSRQLDRTEINKQVLINQQSHESFARKQILRENAVTAAAEAQRAREDEKFYRSSLGKKMRQIDLMGRSINPFASAGSSARSAIRRR